MKIFRNETARLEDKEKTSFELAVLSCIKNKPILGALALFSTIVTICISNNALADYEAFEYSSDVCKMVEKSYCSRVPELLRYAPSCEDTLYSCTTCGDMYDEDSGDWMKCIDKLEHDYGTAAVCLDPDENALFYQRLEQFKAFYQQNGDIPPTREEECSVEILDQIAHCCGASFPQAYETYYCRCIHLLAERDQRTSAAEVIQLTHDLQTSAPQRTIFAPGHFVRAFNDGHSGDVVGWACTVDEGCIFDHWSDMSGPNVTDWEEMTVNELPYDSTSDFCEEDISYNAEIEADSLYLSVFQPGNFSTAYGGTAFDSSGWLATLTAVDTAFNKQGGASSYNSTPDQEEHFDAFAGEKEVWITNDKVTSCREYAYEKFFRYSRFQDLSASLGTDYRAIFDLAYGEDPYDLDPSHYARLYNPSTMVEEDIYDTLWDVQHNVSFDHNIVVKLDLRKPRTIKQLLAEIDAVLPAQGVSSIDNLAATDSDAATMLPFYGDPQNDFFEVPVFNSSEISQVAEAGYTNDDDLYNALLAEDDDGAAVWSHLMAGPVVVSTDGQLSGTPLFNAILGSKLFELFERVPHDWAWHWDRSEELAANYADEQLYTFDQLKDEMTHLLEIRKALVDKILASPIKPDLVHDGLLYDVPGEPDFSIIEQVFDNFINLDSIQSENGSTLSGRFMGNMLESYQETSDFSPETVGMMMAFSNEVDLTASQVQSLVDVIQASYPFIQFEVTQQENAYVPQEQHPISDTSTAPDLSNVGAVGTPFEYTSTVNGQVAGINPGNLVPIDTPPILRLYKLDRIIALLLKKAGELGCFDVSEWGVNSDQNPCNWSPREFVHDIHFELDAKREKSYQECVEATGGDETAIWANYVYSTDIGLGQELYSDGSYAWTYSLGSLLDQILHGQMKNEAGLFGSTDAASAANITGWGTDGTSSGWTWLHANIGVFDHTAANLDEDNPNPMLYFGQNTKTIDRLFEMRENVKHYSSLLNIARLQRIAEDADSQNSSSMDNSKGNSLLSLNFTCGWDWELLGFSEMVHQQAGIENESQPLGARVSGEAAVNAELFGSSMEIVAADGYVEVAQGSGHGEIQFRIAGEEVWSKIGDVDQKADGFGHHSNIFEAKTRFQVGPVPMSVTFGMSGGMGIDVAWGFNAEMPDDINEAFIDDVLNEGDGLNLKVGIGASIIPYAELEGFAQLAIDAVVVSAGVEVEITIIRLEFPFTAELELAGGFGHRYASSGEGMSVGNLHVDMNAHLDAVLKMLDGKVSAFVQVKVFGWKKKWSKKLFGWSGIKKEIPIFSYDLDPAFDLGASVPIEIF